MTAVLEVGDYTSTSTQTSVGWCDNIQKIYKVVSQRGYNLSHLNRIQVTRRYGTILDQNELICFSLPKRKNVPLQQFSGLQ